MTYTPQEQEVLKQHYARIAQKLRRALRSILPHVGWALYGLLGVLAAIVLAGIGPSVNSPELFLGSGFASGGFPFNAFSTERLPGISPLYPLRLPIVLMNYGILVAVIFVAPLLILRRYRLAPKSRYFLLATFVLLGVGLVVWAVKTYNQPLYGGLLNLPTGY